VNLKHGSRGLFVLKRPSHRGWYVHLRVCITVLFALHVFMSAWLVVSFEGKYTDGRPAPSEINAIVAIDKEQTLIDVKFEKATALIFYSLDRNSSEPEGGEEEADSSDSPWLSEDIDWLFLGRTLAIISLVLMVLAEMHAYTGRRGGKWLRGGCFSFMMLNFCILFPVSYVLDLGSIEGDQFGNTSDEDLMAHQSGEIDFSLNFIGFEFETNSEGYDLGLIPSEEHANFSQTPPESGPTHPAYIAFESNFEFKVGKNIPSLLILPFMWILFPSKPSKIGGKKTYWDESE